MNTRRFLPGALALGLLFPAASIPASQSPRPADVPPKTPQAWTLDEAVQALRFDPDDVYLQYVVLQLARNEGRLDEVAGMFDRWRRGQNRGPDREVELFGLFSGALAVQESLQLEAMRPSPTPPPEENAEQASKETVDVSTLSGPTVKSHPWGEMLARQRLAGHEPEVSPLARCVPADQYLVLFRSPSKLLEAIDAFDPWGDHLITQSTRTARTQLATARLRTQLAVHTDPLTRPFYDLVVSEVAITGSDPFFREGTDMTLLFHLKQPEVFRARMDGFLDAAEESHDDAVRTTGKIGGVEYVHVGTPDRAIHVFSAYPRPDVHVRSNSKVALERVLGAIAGDKQIERLGDSTEYRYMRTLFVRGDEREDVFVYLSDPFIRRLVGPELKLTERRRLLAYNQLRMIGHAAMLHRTQYGEKPESLEELVRHGCAPGMFGEGRLRGPSGGTYRLSDDGTAGVSSIYGHARCLVPCCEVPVTKVTEEEAEQYRQFNERYSRYWRRYFDPIAVRLRITPQAYRAETVILPLIDNTIYTGLARALGGEPEPLDALPVPKRNVFSVALRLNKKLALDNRHLLGGIIAEAGRELGLKGEGAIDQAAVVEFLDKGIGNQISLHVYDTSPAVDLNFSELMGQMLGGVGGRGIDDDVLGIGFLVASLAAPVYVAVPVEDAEVVDRFLDKLDSVLAAVARQPAGRGWFEVEHDFYRLPIEGCEQPARCYNLRFGPVKWRMFFARIGDGLYVASKRFILEDLAAIADQKREDTGPVAHAMFRIRPENWDRLLPTFRLSWAECAREASLDNLRPLSNVARALRAEGNGDLSMKQVYDEAEVLYGARFFCPSGGRYELGDDGREVTSTAHGTAANPRQAAAPPPGSTMDRLMRQFGGMTAELTFLEDGLHAVLTVKRK